MSKTSTRELYQVKRSSSGSREVWTNVPIVVPPVVPSDFPHCKIIDINYQLVVSAFRYFSHVT